MNRRQAITRLATLSTISILPSRILGRAGHTAPNDRLTTAIIGTGSISRSHITHWNDGNQLLALCDVDQKHLQKKKQFAIQKGRADQSLATYTDFREVLARPDIDIIQNATPPHWHAYIAIAAAKAGKHILGEKPMSRTIDEGRDMLRAIQDHKVKFTANTWYRYNGKSLYKSGMTAHDLHVIVKNGLLGDGPITATINAATGFDWKFHWMGKPDLPEQPIPAELDYDTWLGPAPLHTYHPHHVHRTFRGYWDYDGGGLGDMGQHYLDPIQYALGKDHEHPIRVEVDADPQHHFAVGTFRRITITYRDGTTIILDGQNKAKDAPLLATKTHQLYPHYKSNIKGLKEKIKTASIQPAPQVKSLKQAILKDQPHALSESEAFYSCTLVNLAKIAHRTNTHLDIDPTTLTITNSPAANALIAQPNRPQWDHKSLL